MGTIVCSGFQACSPCSLGLGLLMRLMDIFILLALVGGAESSLGLAWRRKITLVAACRPNRLDLDLFRNLLLS